jgi:hypothetical protein
MRLLLNRKNEHGDRVERETGKIVRHVYSMVRSEASPFQGHLRNDVLHLYEATCQLGAMIFVPRARVTWKHRFDGQRTERGHQQSMSH